MALGENRNIVVFVGGVGGAKLALGLQGIVSPQNLTIIVNTADDFWYYGLRICPDLDTVMYTLSGRVDPVNGWGLEGDTTNSLETLRELGEDPWFRLGDKDIATHLLRTSRLREGQTLTQVAMHLANVQQIEPKVLPMTDHDVATIVDTVEQGELDFQTYFVRHRWQPTVRSLRFEGAARARMTSEVRLAIQNADVILFGPSNPWLSIAPILAIPGMRDLLLDREVPRVAITPIIQGQAIKGPAAKIMDELDYEVTAEEVASYYRTIINGFVYDERDSEFSLSGVRTIGLDTMMSTREDKERLAKAVLSWTIELEAL